VEKTFLSFPATTKTRHQIVVVQAKKSPPKIEMVKNISKISPSQFWGDFKKVRSNNNS